MPGWGRVWPLTSLPPSPSCWLSLEGGLLYAFVGPAAAVVLVGTPAPRLPSGRASSCVCFPIGVAPVTRGRRGPQSSWGTEAGPAASCVSGCSLPGGCVAAVYLSGGLCGCVTVRGWWADRWPGQQRCHPPGFFSSTGHSLEEGSPFPCPHSSRHFLSAVPLPFGEDGSAPRTQGYHPWVTGEQRETGDLSPSRPPLPPAPRKGHRSAGSCSPCWASLPHCQT